MPLHVLTGAHWPVYTPVHVVLPAELDAARALFETFYGNHFESRRLTWQHALSYCNVNAYYPGGVKKQFHVSLFQACVLLLFNDSEAISHADVLLRTGLEKEEAGRVLKSLCMGKVRVLNRSKAGDPQRIHPDDEYTWRADFKHKVIFWSLLRAVFLKKFPIKMVRIRINTIQVQETVEESDAVRDAVLRDRQYQVDAAIVRVMKMRRSLAHSLLLAELVRQLPFPITPADIKKRIESLIEREYLERDEHQPMTYRYLA